MRNYRFFLTYYTLIASVVLFTWSVFFGPRPQSFLLTIFVIPIAIYFWLVFSHTPQLESEEHTKIPLFILATLFISVVSMMAYSSVRPEPKNETSLFKEIQSLRQEVAKLNLPTAPGADASTAASLRAIKNDLANLKSATNAADNLLGDETAQVGLVAIKDSKVSSVNVYAEKTLTGKTVGKMLSGKAYSYIDKGPNWYLILLGETQGYVASVAVKEVKN